MIIIFKKYKIIIYFIIILFILINLVNLFSKQIGQSLQINLPYKISQSLYLFYDLRKSINRLANDYNIKFLPTTEFLELDVKKISIKKNLTLDQSSFYLKSIYKYSSFYIDIFEKYLIILNNNGNIYYTNFSSLEKKDNELKMISNNISNNFSALDLFVDENFIFVSGVLEVNRCNFLTLYKANMNLKNLKFENIFASNECMNVIRAGKIQKYKHNGREDILLSTFADPWKENLEEYDPKPQSDKSIFGKILLINQRDKSYSIFSKGHRNIQGLINLNDDVILATEHGPRGGDEINLIKKNKNYGWNEVSYGIKYFKNENYKSNHKINNFEEPIYAFVPSIGISEISYISNGIINEWDSDFLIGSLNSRSLYRIRFNDSYSKVIYFEKIFIGERIRDLKIDFDNKVIILALEESGSIMILKPKVEN